MSVPVILAPPLTSFHNHEEGRGDFGRGSITAKIRWAEVGNKVGNFLKGKIKGLRKSSKPLIYLLVVLTGLEPVLPT